MGIFDRAKHVWNAFVNNRDPTVGYRDYGTGYYHRPDRVRFTRGNERSIVTSVYNRIALDVASMTVQHCQLDDNGRYKSTIESSLNNCFNLEANVDQTGRAFMQDIVMSMFDEGCIAVVPTDAVINKKKKKYDILRMRTGKITQWYPERVQVQLYNERTGKKEELIFPKKIVSIIENPFYAVMNESNSTIQRLKRKLNILDAIDEQSGSGKLDLIIQLPYIIKTDARRQQAEQRRKDIEDQLAGSKYGIAYTDGTEHITQLNRPVENNLMKQIEYLTNLAFSQLGVTQAILDGSADDKTMLNYYSRIIEPILSAITDEFNRKFLNDDARARGETIMSFRDPFKLVPVNDLAEIADKFTRNEILTSNEIRQIVGIKPSDDPKADELRNSNLNHPDEQTNAKGNTTENTIKEGENQNGKV